ncbi:MAG TPA: hypothetical protein VE912_00195, partial [Bacteroidales bacterium]|nr:hypothetical protein [Bacteroidales bacterium]
MLFFPKPENRTRITWIVSGIMLLLLFLLPLLLIGSCEKDNNVTNSKTGNEFGIYLIKGAEDYSFLIKGINELELHDTAWISAADIEIYDFSCHMIYLRNPSAYEPVSVTASPGSSGFVVKVNGVRQYKGTFVSPMASFIPYSPFILYPDIFGCEGSLTIGFSNAGYEDDPRGNETTKQALKEAGIFHGGLAVDLLSVENTSGMLKYT